jgi:Na+-transporting NADH:ubiquinone oxidoreductase subunit C
VQDAEAEFAKVVKSDMVVSEDGTLTPYEGAFVTSYEKDFKENGRAHIFVCEIEGQTKYVIPVYGAGLWGAIWGYVALNEDKNTVYGTYFSHASETPGLGAEIASEHFQSEFKDKHVMDGEAVALGVVKNGKVENPEFQVDGISGGTITSVGVDAMLKGCMTHYAKFLTSKE